MSFLGKIQRPHMDSRRLAIFMFSYPLGVSDVIVNSAKKLADAGFYVDIFIDEVSFGISPIFFKHDRIQVRSISLVDVPAINLEEFSSKWPLFARFLAINRRFSRFPLFLKNIIRLTGKGDYSLLIGVEPFGLVSAYIVSLIKKAPVLYYNMELYQRSNCEFEEAHLLKVLEIEASRKCLFTVIQDKRRAAVYQRENGIEKDQIRYLPISTSGPPVYEKTDYFRKRFNIDKNRKILVYAGHIIEWAMCKEIVLASENWENDHVLIMHSWKMDNGKESYFNEIKEVAGRNVIFSTDPIPHDEFPYALSSADVGLMFYSPIDENFIEIGSSSNKLAQYLKAGLPVIASDFRSIRDIFETYKCGVCVTGPDKISSALLEVFHNYDNYQKGAYQAYREHYDFDVPFSPILEEIKAYCV